jgi:hypothetical protein
MPNKAILAQRYTAVSNHAMQTQRNKWHFLHTLKAEQVNNEPEQLTHPVFMNGCHY